MTEEKFSEDEVKTLLDRQKAEYEEEWLKSKEEPEAISKDTQFKFLREILNTNDSKKIAFLREEELGKIKLSARGYMKVALLAQTLDLPEMRDYYLASGEIVNASSMSRKGKFLELIFTQIKKHVSTNTDKPKSSGFFANFGNKNNQQGGDND